MFRKTLSLLVAGSMIISSCVVSYADTTQLDMTYSNVPGTQASTYSFAASRSSEIENSVNSINFEERTTQDPESGESLKILSGVMRIGRKSGDFYVSGDLTTDYLDDGKLISGPLKGIWKTNQGNQEIILGYMNRDGKTCISMAAQDGSLDKYVFGQTVLDEQDINTISINDTVKSTFASMMSFARSVSYTDYYDYRKSTTAKMKSSKLSKKTGIYIRLYQEKSNGDELLLFAKTNTDSIEPILSNDPFSRGVEPYELKLGMYIDDGNCTNTYPDSKEDGSNVYLIDILADAAGYWGVPTGTLSTLIKEAITGSKGYLKIGDTAKNAYLKMRAGSKIKFNMDDNYVPLLLVAVDPDGTSVTGDLTGYCEYRERYSIPGSGYVYHYYESKTASSSFSLNVID